MSASGPCGGDPPVAPRRSRRVAERDAEARRTTNATRTSEDTETTAGPLIWQEMGPSPDLNVPEQEVKIKALPAGLPRY
ncbi:unnamed protein product [Clonostachys rosea]|uniref:Uncharacterized protein n=1 Tax=Bionectria ochroleuca TaxID=29856 RepID=A0ABY6UNF8_BIOOC|nr:unnamed protein product [Clonostachys rosea]